MKPLILVIDDDQKLNNLLTDFFNNHGFKTETATHPDEGLKKLKITSPDIIILDIMLPDKDGFEVCKIIRKDYKTPIIMLTARGDVNDKIVGLETGADDYLAKPFEPRELVARIHSVLRRTSEISSAESCRFGSLEINFVKMTATLENELLDLTTNEFAALNLLVKNRGNVLNRDQIMDELRGMECDPFNRSVDITMSRLRQKLRDDPKSPQYIKTVWGTGYIFIGDTHNNEG